MVSFREFTAIQSHEKPGSAPLHSLVFGVADLDFDELLACKLLEVSEVVFLENLVYFGPHGFCRRIFFFLLFLTTTIARGLNRSRRL